MSRSLRWNITANCLVLVIFSLAVAAVVLIPGIAQVYSSDYKRAVLNEAMTIARLLETREVDGASIARLDDIASQSSWREGVYVGVKDAQGRPPDTSRWAGQRSGPIPSEIAAALQGRTTAVVRGDIPDGESRIFAAAPIHSGKAIVGVVQVSVPHSWLDRALQKVWVALGEALLASIVAALLFGAWRARALAAPVLDLVRAAKRISAGDLTARAEIRSRDEEIGQLGETFNAMADELRAKLTAISEERNKIEAIISSMSDAVVAVDLHGTILLLNRAAEDLLGLPANARGRRLGGTPADHPCWRCIETAAREERDFAEEFSPTPLEDRILHLHATPLRGPAGSVAGAVAVVRDVTDLRRAERLRRELTANVSHELRTPLTSIKGFAETLLGGAMADEAACRRFLTIIDDEATRLMKLVDDLMDLSRLEARVVSMEPSPVRLDALVAEALSRMRPQADRKRILLRAASPEPVVALADRDRILQVVTNLLDNAIHFTPEGGTVEVSAARTDDKAVVSVTDTGRGIPADDLPRIFDRFYRVDRSRSRGAGGTGLGLAIARHIVEAHGGRITVASRINAGSVFTFTLPSQAPLIAAVPAPATADPVTQATAAVALSAVPGPEDRKRVWHLGDRDLDE